MGELDVTKKIEEVVGKKNFKKLGKFSKSQVSDWVVACAIIAVIATLAASTSILYMNDNNQRKSTNNSSTAASDIKHVLLTKETANTDAFTVSVTDVYESTSAIRGLSHLGADEVFLVFTLTIKNKTSLPQPFYVSNQLFARDPRTGTLFTNSPAETTKPYPSGMIDPGDTATGQISFIIPKTLARPLLYIDLGWDDIVPIVFSPLQ